MNIKYQEYDIEDVFRYFASGFKPKKGEKVQILKTNYDPRTGKVIFVLYCDNGKKKVNGRK